MTSDTQIPVPEEGRRPLIERDLRERIKELTCLYGIARVVEHPGLSLPNVLNAVVGLLPPAWQYPSITGGRIVLDGATYATDGFHETSHQQCAPVVIGGRDRGLVQVVYTEERPPLDEGPFLKEERDLIDAVAREVATIIERREAEAERARLQEQVRHADRLATIGQLAAGVAHEINEPLGNILGFAQLALKSPDAPEQTRKDLERIEAASLHAREIIRKLMVFARQTPPSRRGVDLSALVEDGLLLFESRCAKAGITLTRDLEAGLPEVTADPGQLRQVLVNLLVNAMQAMPNGGELTVRTRSDTDHVSLIVEDGGVGMAPETVKQVFLPFFTTKDVGEGTGLGLAVVHGIVSAHGGRIGVESQVGLGSRFEVQLPLDAQPSQT